MAVTIFSMMDRAHDLAGLTSDGFQVPGHRVAPPAEATEVAACMAWLREFAIPTKTIRRRNSSYGLKHCVERWLRREGTTFPSIDREGREFIGGYVSNGAFILAAIGAGFRWQRIDYGPNAHFAMTFRRGVRLCGLVA